MKKILLSILVSFSFVGMASNMSWDQVFSNSGLYKADTPQFQLSHGYFVKAQNACTHQGYLYLKGDKKSRTICTSRSGGENEDYCDNWETVTPKLALVGKKYTCDYSGIRDDGGECVWNYKNYSIPTTFPVNVYKITHQRDYDNSLEFMFRKNYTISSCYDYGTQQNQAQQAQSPYQVQQQN